jgi:SAM-dependent methyltransferase
MRMRRHMHGNDLTHLYEPAYDDYLAVLYDEWYPELFDPAKGPYRAICELFKTFSEFSMMEKSEIRILDCACGTGNNYIALTKAGYDTWACDGSGEMLKRAVVNSETMLGGHNEKLITAPVRWTDSDAFDRHFADKLGSFDAILVNSNSLCHIPSTPEYMQEALKNFRRLLKSGGRLLIDTKKYIQSASVDGVSMFMELQYVSSQNGWIIRSERHDPPRTIAGKQDVHFHTRLHYDVDPCFKKCRALLVITMYGSEIAPRTMLLPYYPLPANVLEENMKREGFATLLYPAKESPINWSYDFVVGQKT